MLPITSCVLTALLPPLESIIMVTPFPTATLLRVRTQQPWLRPVHLCLPGDWCWRTHSHAEGAPSSFIRHLTAPMVPTPSLSFPKVQKLNEEATGGGAMLRPMSFVKAPPANKNNQGCADSRRSCSRLGCSIYTTGIGKRYTPGLFFFLSYRIVKHLPAPHSPKEPPRARGSVWLAPPKPGGPKTNSKK